VSSLEIVTFGCRLNAYESEIIREKAAEARLDDAVIFNTCAVTAEAVRQARQAIRKARRERPDAKIIVTGCAAQIDAAAFADMPEIDRVLGNVDKLSPIGFDFGVEDAERIQVGDIMAVKEIAPHLVQSFVGRARAFVQIQNGCDHRCTFCIIPFGRGMSRSVPAGAVIDQIRTLVGNGYREIVLTGVDLTSYGADLPAQPALGNLVRRILKLVPELPRLRLSSIDSIEIDSALYAAIAEEERLMPHFHLSLQSGDDLILKRMKRRHSNAEAEDCVGRIRDLRSDVAFGADLIAGFPTETEAQFENSLALVERLGLAYLHVFPYSARPGTAAARMPQIPRAIRQERAARLRIAGEAALASYLSSQIGRHHKVLVESERLGRTESFAPIAFGSDQEAGTIIDVRAVSAAKGLLVAA